MKTKLQVVSLILVLAIALAACGQTAPKTETPAATTAETPAEKTTAPETSTADAVETASEKPIEVGAIAKFGLGTIVSLAKSKPAEGEKGAVAQEDTTVAAVAFDAEGRIVDVTIDVAQNVVKYQADGALETDLTAALTTKLEKGADYGMKKASGIGKEWNEQIAAFEKLITGKTVSEIIAFKTYEKDAGHPEVLEDADMASSVTIDIGGYRKAIQKAWDSAKDVTGAIAVGLGADTSIGKSKPIDAEKGGAAQFDTYLTAVAVGEDKKIVGVQIDVAQNKVNFDGAGAINAEQSKEGTTKKAIGADYGMVKASSIGKEWHEQVEAFENWIVGKTIQEVLSLSVSERDASHKAVPADPDLVSSVTITVDGYQAVVNEAYERAIK